MKQPTDKNSLGHYILEVRPSDFARKMNEHRLAQGVDPARYDGIGLFFCPAAGAEAPFATGRMNLTTGEVNTMTYNYFASLVYAEFDYRYERS